MKQLKIPLIFVAIVVSAFFILNAIGFSLNQTLSSCIFLIILCGTLFYWPFRVTFAFIGIAALLATGLLNTPHLIEHAGLDISLFLVGMMCLIGHLEEKHFFEYLIAKAIDKIGHQSYLLMAGLMGFASVSAALVDEVTSILFMMSTTFHLTRRYKVNPIPFLLMIVFATNIGSSATAVGNPIGVMIALRAGLTFADFLRWATPISIIALAVMIPMCFLLFGNAIRELGQNMEHERKQQTEIAHVHYQKKDIRICWALFLTTIILLVSHHALEELFGVERNTLLLGVSLLAGGVAILLNAATARDFFMKRVDWWTLTFFMALFASVGTLKYTGVTDRIATGLISVAGGNSTVLLVAFTGAVSLLTGFMDNVLAVATFIPIAMGIKANGIFVYPFWWGMLFGGTLYGNLTIIGSTANIVAVGMLEREYKKNIGFMEWMKPGFIVSTVTIGLALLLIYLQIPLMPK
jgi:Na+/H+ antiporter NhaD/arsenite permease-like protein